MLIQQISLTLLLFLVPLQVPCIAQENSTTPGIQCNASSTPPSTRFRFYLSNKILALQTASRSKHFYYTMGISDQFIPILYASFLCRGDVNSTRCFECVSRATEAAQHNCVNTSTQAVVWRDVCMFRYSNLAFSGRRDESPAVVHNNETVSIPASVNATQLDEAVKGAAGAIATKLGSSSEPYGIKYATVAANVSGDDQAESTIYAMGECTWDLIPEECRLCVHDCASRIPGGKVGGRVMFPSCNFRFEMNRFYGHGVAEQDPGPQGGSPRRPNPRAGPVPSPTSNLTSDGSTGSQPGGRKMVPPKWKRPSHAQDIAGFGSSLAVILLMISGALFFAHRRKKNKQASQDMDEITSADSLQLEFSKIRSATHNFAADKKLGQGGFGEVYKGKFENGQVIAVKRLSRDSKQGITEFKTEILLVANLQHRNLVKLLGFCFSGKEKILVYEYLSNSSLDRLLFDPIKREALNWETRFRIISGIAKGLLYLHEDSRLKIIHRDLKTSNILLDDFMNPKISDFGMAKLFGVDQTRDATKTIVGTYHRLHHQASAAMVCAGAMDNSLCGQRKLQLGSSTDFRQRFSVGNGPRKLQLRSDIARCRQTGLGVVFAARLSTPPSSATNSSVQPVSSDSPVNRKSMVCAHCGKKSHGKTTCYGIHGSPNWLKEKIASSNNRSVSRIANSAQKGTAPASSSLNNTDRQAFGTSLSQDQWMVVMNMFDALKPASDKSGMSSNWILDTGASFHMTGDQGLLQDLNRVTPISVKLPDGNHSTGSVEGSVSIGGLYLQHVLFVPNLTCNLLSLAQLSVDLNLLVLLTNKLCVLQNINSRTVIGVGKQSDGVY